MKCVLFLTGYHMKVFEWQGRKLIGYYDFTADRDSLHLFEDYISQAARLPTQLLVDLLEEDFNLEDIPHVGSRDRKIIINRMLDRHYRGNNNYTVTMLGRRDSGRRDDQILISALSSLESVTPWLEILDKYQVPLAGIWSLPLVSIHTLKKFYQQEDHVLLISRQMRSAVRESYFKKGRLVFSRQDKLAKELRRSDAPETAAEIITQGVDQIHRFLTNQRILGFTETLHVYSIVPHEIAEQLNTLCEETRSIKYRFISLNDLVQQLKLQNCEGQEADVLYSYVCSESSLWQDHYAEPKHKHEYFKYVIERSFYQVASVGSLLCVMLGILLWLSRMELSQEMQLTESQTRNLSAYYQREFNHMEEELANAYVKEKSVTLAGKLINEAAYAPQTLFKPLSEVFNQNKFTELQLNSLLWQKVRGIALDEVKIRELSEQELNDYYSQETPPSNQAVLVLQGELKERGQSYREKANTMQDFVAELKKIAMVERVFEKRKPVDVRPRSAFTDQSGEASEENLVASSNNEYELHLLIRPAGYERRN